jgi:hypothetical protein
VTGASLIGRLPGGRVLERLGLVLRNRSARAVREVRSWTSVVTGAGLPPMGIRSGKHLAAAERRKLPIVVIVAQGLGDGDAEKLARQIEEMQLFTRSFRPLFVIDSAEFAPFRQRGYVVERVMPADELAAVNPGDDHGEYVRSRIAAITRIYRAASVVPFPTGGQSDLPDLLVRLADVIPAKAPAARNH